MDSSADGELCDFIFPTSTQLADGSHERPMVGPRRNRGFQDVIEEVSDGGGEESGGSEGARSSIGSSKVIVGGRPTFSPFS